MGVSADALLAITVLWGFIFIYAVMGTMDFGAGFWSMIYLNQKKTKATNIANRYLSPTWEVTNVFIVAIVVAVFSFFPGAAYILGTVLLIPGSMILLLLAIRSGFLVFSHIAKDYERALTYISGISGFIIPALLISILPITHGKYIKVVDGVHQLQIGTVFTSPNVFAFIGFAVSSTLFLSSLLLADYSRNLAGEEKAYEVYRRDALITGPISLVMAFLIMLTLRTEANWIYSNMMEYLPALIGSVVMFLLAGAALFIPSKNRNTLGRPRIAMVAVLLQYFFASYAYGRAHLPYMIYPDITLDAGFTDPNTFHALFISYIVGFAILFPGFIFFWNLFMKNPKTAEENES